MEQRLCEKCRKNWVKYYSDKDLVGFLHCHHDEVEPDCTICNDLELRQILRLEMKDHTMIGGVMKYCPVCGRKL